MGVRLGYLPTEAANFQQKYLCTFDIESLEYKYDGDMPGTSTTIEMLQRLVSLAVGSNIPNTNPKFFCRSSSHPSTEKVIIDQFVDHLELLHKKYMALLPCYIQTAIDRLENVIKPKKNFNK